MWCIGDIEIEWKQKSRINKQKGKEIRRQLKKIGFIASSKIKNEDGVFSKLLIFFKERRLQETYKIEMVKKK